MPIEKSSSESSEKIEQTLAEKKDYSELLNRLTSIMRSISRKPDLVVTTEIGAGDMQGVASLGQDARKAWYRKEIVDPVTREYKGEYVHIPEKILESHENIAKGKAAHEASHVGITRMGRFIPDKVIQELGFHQFIAAIEERPTDQAVRDRFPGAGLWLDETRKEQAVEVDIASKTKEKIGYIPKSFQLSDLIIFSPQFKENIPSIYSDDVIELYKKIQTYVETIEHTLPKEAAPEEEIIKKAKDRYKIAYNQAWPEVKKLVEEDVEQEKLRQMLNKSREQKEIDDALKELDEALKEELASAKNSAKKKQKQQEKENEEGDKPEMGASEEQGTEDNKKESGNDEPNQGSPMPMDKLSEKLLKALEKIFKSLPKQIQKALEAAAKEILEEIEDEMVKEFSGKLEEAPIETHKEFKEREEETKNQERKKIEKEKTDEEMKEISRIQAGMEANKDVYDQTYAEIRELEEKLYRELEEVFTPNIKRKMRLKSAGSKINLPAVFRWEGARQSGARGLDNRIFETVHLPEKQDYAITLLNDLSGSMNHNDKIYQDFKGKILLAESLNRLGIKNEILGFQDEIIIFKTFDEELTDVTRKKMSGMLLEVGNDNPGGHNRADSNWDGPCLLEASKNLQSQSAKEKFLLVISDGQPTGGAPMNSDPTRISWLMRGEKAEEALHEAVETIIKNTDQKLIGIGLGPGTKHVGKFYPTSLPGISVEKLTETLGELLKDMILHPQKYAYNKK